VCLTFAGGDLKREARRVISNPSYDPFLVGQPDYEHAIRQLSSSEGYSLF
jgi:hypothetical protein